MTIRRFCGRKFNFFVKPEVFFIRILVPRARFKVEICIESVYNVAVIRSQALSDPIDLPPIFIPLLPPLLLLNRGVKIVVLPLFPEVSIFLFDIDRKFYIQRILLFIQFFTHWDLWFDCKRMGLWNERIEVSKLIELGEEVQIRFKTYAT